MENAKSPSAEPPRDDARPRLGGSAAPAAAWLLAFLTLRVFAVSGYDWDTAFAVSTTLNLNDGVGLVFGSLMAGYLLTALVLMLVLPVFVAALLWSPHGRRPVVVLGSAVGLVVLCALTASFGFWWLPVSVAALLGVFALIRGRPEDSRLRRVTAGVFSRVGWAGGVAVLLVAAFVGNPWVPREQIATASGTIQGYVLRVEPGYLNVLTEDREFVILNQSDVRSRR